MYIGKAKYERANVIMQYAIIVAVVGAAFMAMNIYVKRGFQGKLKDMTDHFISGGNEVQQDDSDPKYSTSTSRAHTDFRTTAIKEQLLGGGIRNITTDDLSDTNVFSRSEERRKPVNPESEDFISTDSIAVEPPQRQPDSDFEDENLRVLEARAEEEKAAAEADLAACGEDAQCIANAQRRIDEANEILRTVHDAQALINVPVD